MEQRTQGKHDVLLRFYRRLIQLRKESAALRLLDKDNLSVRCDSGEGFVEIHRRNGTSEILLLLNFKDNNVEARPTTKGRWLRVLDSAQEQWLGPGSLAPEILEGSSVTLSPLSTVLYKLEGN